MKPLTRKMIEAKYWVITSNKCREMTMERFVQAVNELLNDIVEQKSSTDWIEYDYDKIASQKPNKCGKYLVCRKDGKIHFENWNGTGWAYNDRTITYWKTINSPYIITK